MEKDPSLVQLTPEVVEALERSLGGAIASEMDRLVAEKATELSKNPDFSRISPLVLRLIVANFVYHHASDNLTRVAADLSRNSPATP